MSVFGYTAIDAEGKSREGTIDAVNIDLAINALQRRGLVISKIDPVEEKGAAFKMRLSIFDRVSGQDIVMLSRQITTLFEAQVSALRAFRLLASEARTPKLAEKLTAVANDIQSGSSISTALSKHPDVFTNFYVNMVRAGEESGKLDETFSFLAHVVSLAKGSAEPSDWVTMKKFPLGNRIGARSINLSHTLRTLFSE